MGVGVGSPEAFKILQENQFAVGLRSQSEASDAGKLKSTPQSVIVEVKGVWQCGQSHSISGRAQTRTLLLASLTGPWCHVSHLERLNFLAEPHGTGGWALASAAWGEQNLPLLLTGTVFQG